MDNIVPPNYIRLEWDEVLKYGTDLFKQHRS